MNHSDQNIANEEQLQRSSDPQIIRSLRVQAFGKKYCRVRLEYVSFVARQVHLGYGHRYMKESCKSRVSRVTVSRDAVEGRFVRAFM